MTSPLYSLETSPVAIVEAPTTIKPTEIGTAAAAAASPVAIAPMPLKAIVPPAPLVAIFSIFICLLDFSRHWLYVVSRFSFGLDT